MNSVKLLRVFDLQVATSHMGIRLYNF